MLITIRNFMNCNVSCC